MMIPAERAVVVPYAISPQTGEAIALEDLVAPLLATEHHGAIAVTGPVGSGKSTALRHLAATASRTRRARLVDVVPSAFEVRIAAESELVVYAAPVAFDIPHVAVFPLAPWEDDQIVEYLVAAHPSRCGSVMARVAAARDRRFLGTSPELWRPVLDAMSAEDELVSLRGALARCVDGLAGSRERVAALAAAARRSVIGSDRDEMVAARMESARSCPALARFLLHRPVRLLLAARWIAAELASPEGALDVLDGRWPRDLVREVASIAGTDAAERLRSVVEADRSSRQPMAASVLHAMKADWAPLRPGARNLSHAYLETVRWPGAVLEGARLDDGGFRRARLENSILSRSSASRAAFQGACLRGARLDRVVAHGASFAGADLAFVHAEGADFTSADLRRADLDGALLDGSNLSVCRLDGARFSRASLAGAALPFVRATGADFSSAVLDGADLDCVDLRGVILVGSSLRRAILRRADLEGLDLSECRFDGADLEGALLTASRAPGVSFRDARLVEAKLASVAWDGVDLRGADLVGATFHMGSSRSGLVFSPIACEGSRTGFYTDDFDDRRFKPPEEIRKANLRRADLRGARIDGVDFYLVDLRDAIYDDAQRAQFVACQAILETPG